MRRFSAIAILMSGISGLALAVPAAAQVASGTVPAAAGVGPAALQSPAQAQTEPAAASDIVVTGSRIIRNGNSSPTPVTVVAAQDLQLAQPTTIADGLNTLPVFSGSRNQFGNPLPAGGNGAANQLNLRNLGANRNLVLFDGHRVPSTLSTGVVDVDMIPQLLISRVDVVTGGVSAVYGSDAISGVINFITDRKFTGVKAQAQAGVSRYGDDANQEAGLAIGTNLFGGRGHFEASYEFRNDEGVLYRSDRPWNRQWAIEGSGTAALPYTLLGDVRLAGASFGGLINTGVLAGQHFATNGVLSAFNPGITTASTCCNVGGDGAYYDTSLKAPLKSHQIFGRFDYDFGDSLHAYVVGSANIKINTQYIDPPFLNRVTISSTNAFLAPAYQTALATAKQTTFVFSEFMRYNAPREQPVAISNQYFFNAGLDGKLFAGFKWDASYIHGLTEQRTRERNNQNLNKLSAALDAVVNPANGQVVCNVTLTNPGLYPGCVPLNAFGPSSANQDAVNYFLQTTNYIAHTATDDFEASVSGSPFSTWAGPVGIALSGEWRRQTFSATSDAAPTTLQNCTGLRYNCSATTALYFRSFSNRSEVSQTVKEGAIEADVPLLSDVRFFKSLSLNGAARYTSYNTSGNYTTWKVGANWQVDDDLSFRATRSRDIRAPTLDDLYAPTSQSSITNQDLLTGVSKPTPLYAGGNPNLTAEIGHTTTAGVVFQPHWLPGFSVAVDFYRIRVNNAISTQLGYNSIVQGACYASGGSSPYCALQVRPGSFSDTSTANAVTAWYNTVINIASATTYGQDFEVNYATRLFDRPVSIRVLTTHQPHLYFDTPGLTTLEHAGVAYSTNALYPTPRWRVSTFLKIRPTDAFAIDIFEKWRSPYTMRDDPAQVFTNPSVPALAQTNLNLSYDIKSGPNQWQMYLNIQNLLDKDPPPVANSGTSTRPGQYGGWAIGDDPVGLAFTVGVRIRR